MKLTVSFPQSNWKWPDIPGLHEFSGPLLHSANWLDSFVWTGLKVAVVGNGSSGVQIVPAIQKGEGAQTVIRRAARLFLVWLTF